MKILPDKRFHDIGRLLYIFLVSYLLAALLWMTIAGLVIFLWPHQNAIQEMITLAIVLNPDTDFSQDFEALSQLVATIHPLIVLAYIALLALLAIVGRGLRDDKTRLSIQATAAYIVVFMSSVRTFQGMGMFINNIMLFRRHNELRSALDTLLVHNYFQEAIYVEGVESGLNALEHMLMLQRSIIVPQLAMATVILMVSVVLSFVLFRRIKLRKLATPQMTSE